MVAALSSTAVESECRDHSVVYMEMMRRLRSVWFWLVAWNELIEQ